MAVFSSPAERAMVDGRIGPSTVGWDMWGKFGKCMIDPVTGRFYSTTNFSSVRTNTCVCKGVVHVLRLMIVGGDLCSVYREVDV